MTATPSGFNGHLERVWTDDSTSGCPGPRRISWRRGRRVADGRPHALYLQAVWSSQPDEVGTVLWAERVPGVEQQPRRGGEPVQVIAPVGGEERDQVGAGHRPCGQFRAGQLLAIDGDGPHQRVVEGDPGAVAGEGAHDAERGRLADVADVRLVGDAEDEYPRSLEGLGVLVEGLADAGGHPARHLGVDVLGLLEDAEPATGVPTDLPGQIGGVERDAVAPDPRARG